jgi:hypothetical protein
MTAGFVVRLFGVVIKVNRRSSPNAAAQAPRVWGVQHRAEP